MSNALDAYIAAQTPPVQQTLQAVRAAVRRAVPAVEESISYNIPTFKQNGKPLLYFAAWKKHYSIYPATARLTAALAAHLAPCKIVKSTIQFQYTQPVPEKLIEQIAKFRASEIAASEQ